MPTSTPPPSPVLSLTAAAAYLGVSRSTLHRMLRDGQITASRVSPGRRVITVAALDDHIASRTAA